MLCACMLLRMRVPLLPRENVRVRCKPLPAERAFKLEQSMSFDRERTRDQSIDRMEILSPGSPGSPGSLSYPRDLLTSTSSMRLIKEKKPKPPTSGDLAKLSMYLTAQQHNKLKQHIQQVGIPRILWAGTGSLWVLCGRGTLRSGLANPPKYEIMRILSASLSRHHA